MSSFFKPANVHKLSCALLFASQNQIHQEICFKLVIMPYATPYSWLPWQSLQFSFNRYGDIVAFDAYFMHHENDYQDLANEVVCCVAKIKENHDIGHVICDYDIEDRHVSLPYWGQAQSLFSADLIIQLLNLFRIGDTFQQRFLNLALDKTKLACEHERLFLSLPEPIEKSKCNLM